MGDADPPVTPERIRTRPIRRKEPSISISRTESAGRLVVRPSTARSGRWTGYFVVQYSCGDIHPSARRHGITDDDMLHAVDHSLVVDDLGDDPDRWLVIGPDRAANLLELVMLITAEGDELIIHAMPLRPVYRKLLEP